MDEFVEGRFLGGVDVYRVCYLRRAPLWQLASVPLFGGPNEGKVCALLQEGEHDNLELEKGCECRAQGQKHP